MKELKMREHMKERFGGKDNILYNPPLPQSLNIEINNTCNHKCEFCDFHGPYAPNKIHPARMDFDTIKKILDAAHELGIGCKELGFYLSGEPFVHTELVDAVAYAKKIGYKYVFLTTNGSLAYPEQMKRILDAGLDSIRFSVNAADAKTYEIVHGSDDFDAVVANIKFAHEYITSNNLSTATSLSCVITKRTFGIQNQIRQLFENYVDDILFIPVIVEMLNCSEDIKKSLRIVDDTKAVINHNFNCPILFNTMYIDPNLNVIPCCFACGKNVSFYNLNDDFNLENAWYSALYKEYRSIFLDNCDDAGTLCEDCNLRKQGIERLAFEKEFFGRE
ncbi:MAG: radical SAM protein [Lachnospiraceae bacterium]|nr:radical SAM protein [Lachnospiraceae bacterium]